MDSMLNMLAYAIYGQRKWSDLEKWRQSPTLVAVEIGRLQGRAESVEELTRTVATLLKAVASVEAPTSP